MWTHLPIWTDVPNCGSIIKQAIAYGRMMVVLYLSNMPFTMQEKISYKYSKKSNWGIKLKSLETEKLRTHKNLFTNRIDNILDIANLTCVPVLSSLGKIP